MRTAPLLVTGPAHPDQVWERYAVPARWAEWSPQIRSAVCSTPRIAAGATGTVLGPAGVRAAFVVGHVDDADPADRSGSWTVRAAGLRLGLHHVVRALPGGGTSTELVLDGPAPAVLGYLPLAALALRRLVTR